jgi:hypothetical protein
MDNLLITTLGEYNHLSSWLNGERNYDVAIVNYDRHQSDYNLVKQCVYYDTFSTFKYPGIELMFSDDPRLLRYEYFFMPDEDIYLSSEQISELFTKMRTLNLDLAQPSIEDSSVSFPSWNLFTHRRDLDFIPTNFVEVMCPCFSHSALLKCLPTFPKSRSGWGLDLVWPSLIGNNRSNMGIINSIVAKHTRRVGEGGLYKALRQYKTTPYMEKMALLKEYNVNSVSLSEMTTSISDKQTK